MDVNRDYQNNQTSMKTSDGEQDSSVIVLPEEDRRDKLIAKINPEVDRCDLQGNQSTKVNKTIYCASTAECGSAGRGTSGIS